MSSMASWIVNMPWTSCCDSGAVRTRPVMPVHCRLLTFGVVIALVLYLGPQERVRYPATGLSVLGSRRRSSGVAVVPVRLGDERRE
jgi:hypothetical protein